MKIKSYIILPIALLASCKAKLDKDLEFNAGTADFSKVIFIGDNLLSGYTNDGLYLEGQENSVALILNKQFEMVGGNSLLQPLMPNGSGTGYLKIDSYTNSTFTVSRETNNSAVIGSTLVFNNFCSSDTIISTYAKYSNPINNFAIPQLRMSEIDVQNLGVKNSNYFNPFYERINNDDTLSYLKKIEKENITFFIASFGISEVFLNAKKGWSCGGNTDFITFENNYRTLLTMLKSKGAKGVLCEIPNIHKLPFLNFEFSSDDSIYIWAKKPFDDNKYEKRAFTKGDKFTLLNVNKIGENGYGTSPDNPVSNSDVLDYMEVDELISDIASYNLIINKLALEFDFPVVVMSNYLLDEKGLLKDEIIFNGTKSTIKYEPNSAISLDGIFPTPRGAAIIANKFIKKINEHYDAKIPLTDINNYEGLRLE